LNYGKARANLKDIFAQQQSDKKIYRRAFFVSMALNFVLVTGITVVCLQHKTVPYIVQVDKHGYSIAISRAEAADWPSDRILVSWVGQYVQNLRTVVTDSRAQRSLIDWVYASTPRGTSAHTFINTWYSENNPYQLARDGHTVEVRIESIIPMGDSRKAWQAKWEESTYVNGVKRGSVKHTGIFTMDVAQNTDLKSVIVNPLGIFITELQTTQAYS